MKGIFLYAMLITSFGYGVTYPWWMWVFSLLMFSHDHRVPPKKKTSNKPLKKDKPTDKPSEKSIKKMVEDYLFSTKHRA